MRRCWVLAHKPRAIPILPRQGRYPRPKEHPRASRLMHSEYSRYATCISGNPLGSATRKESYWNIHIPSPFFGLQASMPSAAKQCPAVPQHALQFWWQSWAAGDSLLLVAKPASSHCITCSTAAIQRTNGPEACPCLFFWTMTHKTEAYSTARRHNTTTPRTCNGAYSPSPATWYPHII